MPLMDLSQGLPEGFEARVKRRGLVYGGWMQQQLILGHPSAGCFVAHRGVSSLTVALVSECIPRLGSDHVMNA